MILSVAVSGCDIDESTAGTLTFSSTVEEIEHKIINPPEEGGQ